MLSIQKSKSHKGKCTPNVLPCRINHNGKVDTSKRYWNPTQTPGISPLSTAKAWANSLDDKTVAYFRGRKLHGRRLKVPTGYQGVVISKTDRILPKEVTPVKIEDDEEAEDEPEVGIMEEQSTFDDVMVWGHETVPEDGADPFVKGMEEWISFAEQVRFRFAARNCALLMFADSFVWRGECVDGSWLVAFKGIAWRYDTWIFDG